MPASTTNTEVLNRLFREVYARDATMDAWLTNMGPPPPTPPWHIRLARRIRWRWYDARVWVAEKVLRLPQDNGDLY